MNNPSIFENMRNFDSNMIDLIEFINFTNNSINLLRSNSSDTLHNEVIDPALLCIKIHNETNVESKRELEKLLRENYPNYKLEKSKIQSYNNDENSIELLLSGELSQVFDNSFNVLSKTRNKDHFLYMSSVVSLISIVEVYFSQLLHCYLTKHPYYAINEKKIRIKDIFKEDYVFDNFNVKDIKEIDLKVINEVLNLIKINNESIINNYIEEFIKGGFNKWIKEIPKVDVKLKINKDLIGFSNEVFQRRHLIIHRNSEVDDKYISSVDEKFRIGYKIKDKIKTDYNYITKAIDTLEFVFLSMSIVFCSKAGYLQNDIYSELIKIIYNNLFHKRWNFTLMLSKFVYERHKEDNGIKVLSYSAFIFSNKKTGKEIEVKKEVFEGKSLTLQLYYNALTEDSECFLKNLKAITVKKGVVEQITSCPIFEKLLEIEKIKKYIDSIKPEVTTKTKIVPLF